MANQNMTMSFEVTPPNLEKKCVFFICPMFLSLKLMSLCEESLINFAVSTADIKNTLLTSSCWKKIFYELCMLNFA